MNEKLSSCKFRRVAISGPINGGNSLDEWYLDPENLRRLGNCIGMRLECMERRVRAGKIKSGTLCKDTCTGDYVLIRIGPPQNEFTRLTQLKISAGEYKILNIVWISEHFEDKHRAVLNWLNNTNLEGIRFFGIEIEWEDTDAELTVEDEGDETERQFF